jgi:hypothetical protein
MLYATCLQVAIFALTSAGAFGSCRVSGFPMVRCQRQTSWRYLSICRWISRCSNWGGPVSPSVVAAGSGVLSARSVEAAPSETTRTQAHANASVSFWCI